MSRLPVPHPLILLEKTELILNRFSLPYLESFDVLSPYGRAERLGGPETMKNCKRNSIFSDCFSQISNRKMLVFRTFPKNVLKFLNLFVDVIPNFLSV